MSRAERGKAPMAVTWFPGRMIPITPSDEQDLPMEKAMVYAAEEGTVSFIPASGDNTVTLSVAAGDMVPCAVRRVLSTGTSASPLYACW